MVISARSLFHFTNSIDNLVGILTDEFKPKFCFEDQSSLFPQLQGIAEFAIPMTCFCDLPLSSVTEHIGDYGGYGLGLTKEWGAKHGINPVIYLRPKTTLAKCIYKVFENTTWSLWENRKTHQSIEEFPKTISTLVGFFKERDVETLLGLLDTLAFIKPYEGRLPRTGKQKTFYNEREWRYVPQMKLTLVQNHIDYRLTKTEYSDEVFRDRANYTIADIGRLSFEPKDIRYIIVNKEVERLDMVKAIKEIKSRRYDEDIVNILATKIISAQRIKDDF